MLKYAYQKPWEVFELGYNKAQAVYYASIFSENMDVMVLVLVSVPFSLSFPLLFLGQSLTNMMGRADIFHKLNARSKDGADVHSHVHSHMY